MSDDITTSSIEIGDAYDYRRDLDDHMAVVVGLCVQRGADEGAASHAAAEALRLVAIPTDPGWVSVCWGCVQATALHTLGLDDAPRH